MIKPAPRTARRPRAALPILVTLTTHGGRRRHDVTRHAARGTVYIGGVRLADVPLTTLRLVARDHTDALATLLLGVHGPCPLTSGTEDHHGDTEWTAWCRERPERLLYALQNPTLGELPSTVACKETARPKYRRLKKLRQHAAPDLPREYVGLTTAAWFLTSYATWRMILHSPQAAAACAARFRLTTSRRGGINRAAGCMTAFTQRMLLLRVCRLVRALYAREADFVTALLALRTHSEDGVLTTLRDVLKMLAAVAPAMPGLELELGNLQRLHDQLAPHVSALRRTSTPLATAQDPALEHLDQVIHHPRHGELVFRRAPDTHTLYATGTQMNHCVGIYDTSARRGACVIVTAVPAHDPGRPVYCLEITGRSVAQFKLDHNAVPQGDDLTAAWRYLLRSRLTPGHDVAALPEADLAALRAELGPA